MLGYFKPRIYGKNKLAAKLVIGAACCLTIPIAHADPYTHDNGQIRRAQRQELRALRQQNNSNERFQQTGGIPSTSAEGIALFRRMLEAKSRLSYRATQVTTVSRQGIDFSTQQYVTRDGANGERIEYFQPAQYAGEIIVDNGINHWHYEPSKKTIEVGISRMKRGRNHTQQEVSRIERGSLGVMVIGQDSIAGRPCSIIEVHSNDGKWAFRRFWVDSATGAQLKVEGYRPNGKLQWTSFFTQIAFNPTIGPRTFAEPRTPAGVITEHKNPSNSVGSIAEAQAQAGFPVRQPTYLPAGFGFQSIQVSRYRQNKMVVLQYNNGLNVVSFYETPAEAGHESPIARSPRPGVVTRTQAGLTLLVVGNLPTDEMTRLINSVR